MKKNVVYILIIIVLLFVIAGLSFVAGRMYMSSKAVKISHTEYAPRKKDVFSRYGIKPREASYYE